jgi:hypothetical protein
MTLADILGKARPPEQPAVSEPAQQTPASRLADLLSVRPSVRADVIGDVRKALERGKFALGAGAAVSLAPAPAGNALPSGLFRKIAKAGPKPKAKASRAKPLTLRELQEQAAAAGSAGSSPSAQAPTRSGYGVSESVELDRIVRLPRRECIFTAYEDLTETYRKPGGTMALWPLQSAALHEAKKANGLMALYAAGSGKTAVSLLVGAAMNAKRIVLLVPPQLRAQLLTKDIPRLNEHFKLPLERLTVVAYSELSSAKSADLLEELKPDLIVADEVHQLRHKTAARVKRFARFMKEHPECRFVGLSGTVTRRKLVDYAHLCEYALRGRSPVPLNYHTLQEWDEAISVSADPLPAGALKRLANPEELEIIAERDRKKAQEGVRRAFRRRLVETEGVVATEEGAVGTSLVLAGLRPEVPLEVNLALKALRETWCLGEDELVDILSVIRAGCQLAAGFYTRWLWPDGVPDREWLEARSAWNKEMRQILQLSRRGLDSPMLVTNAVIRGDLESSTHASWAAVKERYNPEPPRETVWISDFLVREAVRWGQETCDKANGGIIWFMHRALGEAVAKAGDFPFFGGGDKAAAELTNMTPKKAPVIVCSVKAHGTGLNLQPYSRNLFTTPPAGLEAEQTIARTHRPGQEADQVSVDLFVHTEEMRRAWLNSLRDARYVQTSSGQRQKILWAEKIDLPDED